MPNSVTSVFRKNEIEYETVIEEWHKIVFPSQSKESNHNDDGGGTHCFIVRPQSCECSTQLKYLR